MKKIFGFSLVEIIVALIIISVITAALAPIITKRMSRNAVILGEIKQEMQKTESTQFTTSGEHHFIVPEGVTEVEITLVSGGNGGSAGESVLTKNEIKTIGESTFSVPPYLKNKYAKITMCGGGGGGGGMGTNICMGGTFTHYQGAAGGGSGGAIENDIIKIDNKNEIKVYVGGGGSVVYGGTPEIVAPAKGDVVWDGCADDFSVAPSCEGIIFYQSAPGGSVVGGKSYFRITGTEGIIRGGSGGELAGGSGSIYIGDCGLAGGGGGGGNATRFGTYGESHFRIVGGGGGGGGEGIAVVRTETLRYPGGAGGGGGGVLFKEDGTRLHYGGVGGDGHELDYGCIATGGYGGSPNGNKGKDSGCNNGTNYGTRYVATSGYGGDSPLAEYPDNCAGGHGHGIDNSYDSRSYSNEAGTNSEYFSDYSNPRNKGRNGIIVLNYISGTKGGQGGSGGKKVVKKITVNANDDIKIIIGKGGQGGTPAELQNSGSIKSGQAPTEGEISQVYINNVLKFDTNDASATTANAEAPSDENGSQGGKDYEFSCSAGTSGTQTNAKGGNAAGFGGCGGGGGYVASSGGNGTMGYAKISWK